LAALWLDSTKRGKAMQTAIIFFLIALFGVVVVLGTLFCLVWLLLHFEVD